VASSRFGGLRTPPFFLKSRVQAHLDDSFKQLLLRAL
jgi:hypothetical protein